LTQTIRYAARNAAPLLYAAGFVFVAVGAWRVVSFLWYLFHYSDTFLFVLSVAVVFLIGVAVFGVLELLFVRFERLSRPSGWDHLRHCVLLYVALVPSALLSAAYLWSYLADGGSTRAWIFVLLAFLASGCGVLFDALVLTRIWRLHLAGSGVGR
jgi:hypothetical protein